MSVLVIKPIVLIAVKTQWVVFTAHVSLDTPWPQMVTTAMASCDPTCIHYVIH